MQTDVVTTRLVENIFNLRTRRLEVSKKFLYAIRHPARVSSIACSTVEGRRSMLADLILVVPSILQAILILGTSVMTALKRWNGRFFKDNVCGRHVIPIIARSELTIMNELAIDIGMK